MFYKFASNILRDIADKCLLKSFATSDKDVAEMYSGISNRIEGLLARMGVEEKAQAISKDNE